MDPGSPANDVRTTVLPNGLRVITESMSAVRSVAVGFWVGTGSRSESKLQNGISHFIEHMLFKGTPTRGAERIAREMDSIGGHLDAATDRDRVCFEFRVLDAHLERAFEILSDMLLRPKFDSAEVEREKGVILEELKMVHDDPEDVVTELFLSHFWKGQALGRETLGSKHTIASFTPDLLRRCHATQYTGSNLTLTAAGCVRHDQLVELASRYLGAMPTGEPCAIAPARAAAAPPFQLKSKRSLEQLQLCLGVPMAPAGHPWRYACAALNVILGASMSSRLFQNIREERGLAYSIFSELHLYRDTGCLGIYAGSSPENGRQVIDLTLKELRRLREEPVSDDELRRTKEHMQAGLLLSLESTSNRMSHLGRQWLAFDRIYSPAEVAAAIGAVTAGEIQQVARQYFESGRIGLAALGRTDALGIEQGDLTC